MSRVLLEARYVEGLAMNSEKNFIGAFVFDSDGEAEGGNNV